MDENALPRPQIDMETATGIQPDIGKFNRGIKLYYSFTPETNFIAFKFARQSDIVRCYLMPVVLLILQPLYPASQFLLPSISRKYVNILNFSKKKNW